MNSQLLGLFLLLGFSIGGMALLGFVVWMLVHACRSTIPHRTSWILIILFGFGYFGAIAYYFMVYRSWKQLTSARSTKASISPSRSVGSGKGVVYVAGTLVILAILGVITLIVEATVAPTTNLYEPTSLKGTYVLTDASTGYFSHISYASMKYDAIDPLKAGQADRTINIQEFDRAPSIFNPPKNCGFYRPTENSVFAEKIYGDVPCQVVHTERNGAVVYSAHDTSHPDAANYYIAYKAEIITIYSPISASMATNIAASLTDTNFPALRKKVVNSPLSEDSSTTCQPAAIAGRVDFDIAQPAPTADLRIGDVTKLIHASSVHLRDGTIQYSNGKSYSSGKYYARVPPGTETAAVATLKTLPYITSATQGMIECPSPQPTISIQ